MKTTDETKCGVALTGCQSLSNSDLTLCDVCAVSTPLKTTDGTQCGATITGCATLRNSDLSACDVCSSAT